MVSIAHASDLDLDDVISHIRSNQSKLKDIYAETETTITSNIAMPGQESKGPQKMVQKGKIWTKGEKKSKIEIVSPMKQTTITNGDLQAVINPETGQKMVQDLKKMKDQGIGGGAQGEMSLDKAKEYFNFSVNRLETRDPGLATKYVISGVPKKENKFLGKMEFYVDGEKWLPTKVLMYDTKGNLMSHTEIEYQEIAGVWVPANNFSNVNTPMGEMKVEMRYSNIKVNEGIADKEFEVE